MLQVPVYYDDSTPPDPSLYSNSTSFNEVVSNSPYQSYHFESSSSVESNSVDDPYVTNGYQSAQARPHLKLTRPIEVKPNRHLVRPNGIARGSDVDFPSFDSEFRTLYGGAQEYHVIIKFYYFLSRTSLKSNFRSTG